MFESATKCRISYSYVSVEEGVQWCFKNGLDKSTQNNNLLTPDLNIDNFAIVKVQRKNKMVEFVSQICEIDKELENIYVVFLNRSGRLKTFTDIILLKQ